MQASCSPGPGPVAEDLTQEHACFGPAGKLTDARHESIRMSDFRLQLGVRRVGSPVFFVVNGLLVKPGCGQYRPNVIDHGFGAAQIEVKPLALVDQSFLEMILNAAPAAAPLLLGTADRRPEPEVLAAP